MDDITLTLTREQIVHALGEAALERLLAAGSTVQTPADSDGGPNVVPIRGRAAR